MIRSPFAFALVFPLVGCAGVADAPSLAVRPIELRPDTVAVAPPIVGPVAPALAARIAALVARAQQGDRDFTLSPAQTSSLRRGLAAPQGSETWIDAQTRRSALEVARDASTDALSELDALLLATETRVADGSSEGGSAEVRAAVAQVGAIVARQAEVLAALTR